MISNKTGNLVRDRGSQPYKSPDYATQKLRINFSHTKTNFMLPHTETIIKPCLVLQTNHRNLCTLGMKQEPIPLLP